MNPQKKVHDYQKFERAEMKKYVAQSLLPQGCRNLPKFGYVQTLICLIFFIPMFGQMFGHISRLDVWLDIWADCWPEFQPDFG